MENKVSDRRRILANTVVEYYRLLLIGRKARNAPMDWDSIAVEWCVSLGHWDNAPMSASQISNTLEMPRTTVIRKLNEMIARGHAWKTPKLRYCLTKERVENKQACENAMSMARLIIKAGASLSKLDT